MLPFKDKAGETRIKSLRNTLKFVIPTKNTCRIISTGMKLAKSTNMTSFIKPQGPDNLNCDSTYVGEVERRSLECIIDHSGCDEKSHLTRPDIKMWT